MPFFFCRKWMVVRLIVAVVVVSVSNIQGQDITKPGIQEKLGNIIPENLNFKDENGQSVVLRQLIDKPTLLAMVYFECSGICTPLLNGLSEVIDRMEKLPGQEYQIIAVSFDPSETPEKAAAKKENYLHRMKKKIDPLSWRFLTGDSANVAGLMKAVGFGAKREWDGETRNWAHEAALISLSPQGKVCRYLKGITFLPFDVSMAVNEASAGKAVPTISTLLKYCYSYDPEGRKYVLNITRVIGVIMLIMVGSFFIIVVYITKKTNLDKGKNS